MHSASIGNLRVRTAKPPFVTLACLAASLMLGACAQDAELFAPLAPQASLQNAPATSSQSDLQRATEYWGKEYEKKPTDLTAALSYARNLKALGNRQKALSVLQEASAVNGNSKELAGEYGRLALELDQVGPAGKVLAFADDPGNPDWRIVSARGTVLAKQGRYKDAIPYYERALKLSEHQPSVLNNLAMAHALSGDAKSAEDILRQASSTEGAPAKVRQNLALVLGLQGRYDEAKITVAHDLSPEVATSNAAYFQSMVRNETANGSNTAPSSTASLGPKATSKSGTKSTAAPSNWQTNITGSAP